MSDTDVAKIVIADFNHTHTWEEVAALCGGLQKDRFCAVWRGERSPSVVIDRNGEFAADYGRRGPGDPFKVDRFETWCLAQGGKVFKKADLTRRITEYRAEHGDQGEQNQVDSSSPAREARKGVEMLPPADETAEQVVERLRGVWLEKRAVLTPSGRGKLWQVFSTRIGVVLDSDPDRVKFFTSLPDMRAIAAVDDESSL